MTQTIYGKTEGLKKQVLTQLEGIYELRADEGQLISEELALVLRDLTEAINREISIYVDRKGQVTAVAVGSDSHVELPGTDSRRSQNRLCGAACIHTHPSGAPRLSRVDLSALRDLRFDAMAAMAWENPSSQPLLSFGMITDLDEDQQPVLQEFGPFKVKDVAAMPFGNVLHTVEKILAKRSRGHNLAEGYGLPVDRPGFRGGTGPAGGNRRCGSHRQIRPVPAQTGPGVLHRERESPGAVPFCPAGRHRLMHL